MTLKSIREGAGLTQVQAAELVGTTQGAISAWELGRNRPSFDNLCRLASAYKSDVSVISEALMDRSTEKVVSYEG